MSLPLPKSTFFFLAVLLPILIEPRAAMACRYTPLEWQREIPAHANPVFVGQRKHRGWIRDQDGTFIDDEIEKRFSPGEHLDIIVDFNTCLTPGQIRDLLDPFGRIVHIGKLISYAMLRNVSFDDLPTIAALPRVAMVEWQVPLGSMLNASTRAVQSKESTWYMGESAEEAGFLGSNVVVAIVDTGINNEHPAFDVANKFVAGFDATIWEDSDGDGVNDNDNDESGDDSNDPEDGGWHGTHVAGIAVGAEFGSGSDCSLVSGDFTLKTCEDVAPAARFVDVKACVVGDFGQSCQVVDTSEGLEWIGIHAETFISA